MIWLKFRAKREYVLNLETTYLPLLDATNADLYEKGGFTWIFYKKDDTEGTTYYLKTDHGDFAEMVAKKMSDLERLENEPTYRRFFYECGGAGKNSNLNT